MEENLDTLCYCQSCQLERKDIQETIKNFPPSMKCSSTANYLNMRYEQMRDKCLKKPTLSKEIDEVHTNFGCENIYTIVGALTVIGTSLAVVGMLALVIWLASVLPVS